MRPDFTLGSNVTTVPYHIPIIRSQLTRNLRALVLVVYEEVVGAFNLHDLRHHSRLVLL